MLEPDGADFAHISRFEKAPLRWVFSWAQLIEERASDPRGSDMEAPAERKRPPSSCLRSESMRRYPPELDEAIWSLMKAGCGSSEIKRQIDSHLDPCIRIRPTFRG